MDTKIEVVRRSRVESGYFSDETLRLKMPEPLGCHCSLSGLCGPVESNCSFARGHPRVLLITVIRCCAPWVFRGLELEGLCAEHRS